MKAADQDKPISTIPDGVWESSKPVKDEKNANKNLSTDLQGNGYPTVKRSK